MIKHSQNFRVIDKTCTFQEWRLSGKMNFLVTELYLNKIYVKTETSKIHKKPCVKMYFMVKYLLKNTIYVQK